MANLTRWEPFREMVSLRDAMDRLFTEAFTRTAGEWGMGTMTMDMPLDVSDRGDDLVVEAEMPGIKPEDVEVSISGNMLTLRAKSETRREVKEPNYHMQERRRGAYFRSVPLPTSVRSDQAKAEFENGILTLTLPKFEEVKAKSIPVKVKK